MADLIDPKKNIILVVDDEQIVLRLATTAIAEAGFRAAVAENGAAGLECYLKLKDEICLVLADIVMPAVNGIELAERILEIEPNAKVLLMSGYSDVVLHTQGSWQRLPLIRKPFLAAALIAKIQSILGTSAEAAHN